MFDVASNAQADKHTKSIIFNCILLEQPATCKISIPTSTSGKNYMISKFCSVRGGKQCVCVYCECKFYAIIKFHRFQLTTIIRWNFVYVLSNWPEKHTTTADTLTHAEGYGLWTEHNAINAKATWDIDDVVVVVFAADDDDGALNAIWL